MSNISKIGLIAVAGILATGCKPAIEIVSPEKDSVDNQQPEFRIAFTKQIPESFTATINGQVFDSFVLDTENLTATSVGDLSSLMNAGENTFAVEAGKSSAQRTFYYDLIGPEVHLLGVQDGTINGYVYDPGNAVSVSLNGQEVTLDDDQKFSIEHQPSSRYIFDAQDAFGNNSNVQFAEPGEQFDPALAARVNAIGIEPLKNTVIRVLQGLDFKALIGNEPVLDTTLASRYRFYIDEMTLGNGITANLQVLSGNRLRLHARIPSFSATTTARVDTWDPLDVVPPIWFNGTTSGDIEVATDIVLNIQNGKITTSLEGLDIDVNGLKYTHPSLPGWFTDFLSFFYQGFASVIIDIADGLIDARLSEAFNGILSDLVPSDVSIPVAESCLNVAFTAQSFNTSQGGLELGISAAFNLPQSADVVPPLGSYFAPGQLPSQLPRMTSDGKQVQLAAVVSSNTINQVLMEAYRAGLLNINYDKASGLQIGDLISLGGSLPEDGELDVRVQTNGSAAPALIVHDQSEGGASVRLQDFTFDLQVYNKSKEKYSTLMAVTADLQLPVSVSVNDKNQLQISIEGDPQIRVVDLSNKGLIKGSTKLADSLLKQLIPMIMPDIFALASSAIPLPALGNTKIVVKDVWNPSADNQAFLAIGIDLEPISAAAKAQLAADPNGGSINLCDE
ncbi:hypothetical protein [Pelagibaculum spongiae]|uniref:Uncharacterized protein n=1 Tax=Pelagibaculum spongiae TaxID=2080658 RepID=A0A2V1GV80_9GAMM|nr:hypothetical protein [Pelagibaculum spongiae]PVZ63001.1 hypothetical protein DC094_21785 [Pelagibaculum spongiae]